MTEEIDFWHAFKEESNKFLPNPKKGYEMPEISQVVALELYASLKALFHLVETGVLIREIKDDDNYQSFLKQGIQLTKTLANCHQALAKVEGG